MDIDRWAVVKPGRLTIAVGLDEIEVWIMFERIIWQLILIPRPKRGINPGQFLAAFVPVPYTVTPMSSQWFQRSKYQR